MNYSNQVSQADKIGCLIWVSGGKKIHFLIKTVLNQGIHAISFQKIGVKLGTVLIETVLSGDPLYVTFRDLERHSKFGRYGDFHYVRIIYVQ